MTDERPGRPGPVRVSLAAGPGRVSPAAGPVPVSPAAGPGNGQEGPATGSAAPRPRLALLVNPVAGIGGAVGLKGSDGEDTVRRALELGAVPHAGERAEATVRHLLAAWPAGRELPVLLSAPGPMGESAARHAGLDAVAVGTLRDPSATTADDTRRIVGELARLAPGLLLVVGGDGTMRDVCTTVGASVPVLGVPAGVKIHSPAFATAPGAAGDLAAAFLAAAPGRQRTRRAEVLDLDEDAYRHGEVAPRLFGEVLVPAEDRRLQARKEPSPASEAAAASAAAEGVVRHLPGGSRVVLAPGSTVRAVAERLGVPKTLVGVDVVDLPPAPAGPAAGSEAPDATGRGGAGATVIAADAGAAELERLVAERPAVLVVTPIGGQGFVLGRGNQQLSPGVVRAILDGGGRDAIIVVASPAKLAGLRGRPLLVDSGDADLDADLAGHLTVITGPYDRTVYRVAPA